MKGKIDIIASLTPPSIHDVWLNLNDNKLYRYGTSGWMSLIDNRKPGQSGGSTNLEVQSDWLANKPVLPEYIKNRTHYLEVIDTYNKPGSYDFPTNYSEGSLKFALLQGKGEDIIVDVPYPNSGININDHIRVDRLDDQFRLRELTLGSLELIPLKLVVINKHLNESYLPENIKADFMQPDETKQSFIRNNPFFYWRQIIIETSEVGTYKEVLRISKAPVYVSNGNVYYIINNGGKLSLLDKEGTELGQITHKGTYLSIKCVGSGVFWIAQPSSVADWNAPDESLGYIANKPFNAGYKVSGMINGRVSFINPVNSFNHDTLRLRYEGKYYRLPYIEGSFVDIDDAFRITFAGKNVSGNNQTYTYTTQNIKSDGRDQIFTIESNIGATELCDLNIPNTIARNWKILKENHSDVFLYNPNILENHTYYILESSSDKRVFKIREQFGLINMPSDVFEVKFFIVCAGNEVTPFSFDSKNTIHWEGGLPEVTGQAVEITIKYIGDLALGSVKIYE